MIRPLPHIGAMAAYALADITPPVGKQLIGLSQNESLRPPAPGVAEALRQAVRVPHLYPDPDWTRLRGAIGRVHDVDPVDILCGNGSLDLIGCLARAYLGPGLAALIPAHAYPFFRSATLMTGARADLAGESVYHVSPAALKAALTPETRIVFVANPGNPTGTRLPNAELRRLREALPTNVLLVIDEAYGEFADHLDAPLFDLVGRGDTVVLRTFSKAYALAGLRVGWGLFPAAIATELRKLMNPNNVALAGQLAAEAALQDQAYMRETCRLTAAARDAFIRRMQAAGLDCAESHTNFALIRLPSAQSTTRVTEALRAEGVFVRPQGAAGLPHCLRVTIGGPEDMVRATPLIETCCIAERTRE